MAMNQTIDTQIDNEDSSEKETVANRTAADLGRVGLSTNFAPLSDAERRRSHAIRGEERVDEGGAVAHAR